MPGSFRQPRGEPERLHEQPDHEDECGPAYRLSHGIAGRELAFRGQQFLVADAMMDGLLLAIIPDLQ